MPSTNGQHPLSRPASDRHTADDDLVVLVDTEDRELGTMGKLAAHQPPGALHRAFSVFLFNADGAVLLQQRAATKHHFAGRWSNTCCSHPRPGEGVVPAGRRRLQEELGVSADLIGAGAFVYEAGDPVSGLVERELDHVLVGRFDGTARPNPDEVGMCRWVPPATLQRSLAGRARSFTPWFPLALPLALEAARHWGLFDGGAEGPVAGWPDRADSSPRGDASKELS